MIALWVKSIEFVIITWRTRGFLRATPDAILSWYGRGEITADMVKGVFEHQFTSIKETSKEYQATIYGQAGFKIGRANRPTVVVRSRAKRAREKDISLNARKENSKRLCQEQLEQVTGAKVEAVQVPSRQEELLARKLKDKETRAAKKQRKALEKIQAEANRFNSERFMQRFLGNRRIEPLEKRVSPKGDG
jgi:hypothetical protein